MATPMSAQQANEQRALKRATVPKVMASSAPVAATQPVTGISAPTAVAKKIAPKVSTPQSANPVQLNAATGGVSSATGFGGATYGTNGATNKAIAANQSAIANQSGFRDSEIARTQAVIKQREAAGQDTSAQQKYLTTNLGYSAQQAQPTRVSYPQGDAVTNVQSSSNLQQQATDQTALERAALLNAINTQRDSLKNNAEYGNQLIQDNRVLEDQTLMRNANPFSGQTGYQLAQVQRGRSIDDTSRTATLESVLGGLDQEIANFDKLTPERQRGIYQELLAAERQFGLSVGSLTGNYGGNRTLAGASQDWGQLMDLANQTGNLPNSASASGANGAASNSVGINALAGLSGARTLAGQQMDLATKESNWSAYQDMVNQTGNLGAGPLSNWGNLVKNANSGEQTLAGKTYDRGVFESNRNFNYTQGRDSVQDAQWEAEFSRIATQDGIQNAIAWANQSLNQAEFEDSSAYKWAGLDAELAAAASEGEKYQGMSANDVVSNVRKNFGDEDGVLPTDSAIREQMYMQIIGAGLPGSQEDQALAAIGFTPAQIKSLDDKYLGK